MQKTPQGKKKHEVTDSESFLLIEFIREICVSDSDLGAIEYLEKYDGLIRGIGRILELLGLAELDERRLIGWKATRRLIGLIADRGARPLKGTKTRASYTDLALLGLLLVAANMDDWGGFSGSVFAYQVLEASGLLRRGGSDDWRPTPLLAQLFVEADELESYN
jgi:hypothetical protein